LHHFTEYLQVDLLVISRHFFDRSILFKFYGILYGFHAILYKFVMVFFMNLANDLVRLSKIKYKTVSLTSKIPN